MQNICMLLRADNFHTDNIFLLHPVETEAMPAVPSLLCINPSVHNLRRLSLHVISRAGTALHSCCRQMTAVRELYGVPVHSRGHLL